jgi:uncharacterized FAD-dependent dehydrogenase
MLKEKEIRMEGKAFAVGLRIQHPQNMINISQYGSPDEEYTGPASYKLTHRTKEGRNVYSFCMCPGGYVVNASSEPGRLAVNGMSYSGRKSLNANSAIIVSVDRDDFGSGDVLAGMTLALLAQGQTALCAATNASLAHALASRSFSANFALTPFALINAVASLA